MFHSPCSVISTEASLFFPPSACFLFSLGKKKSWSSCLWWFPRAEHTHPSQCLACICQSSISSLPFPRFSPCCCALSACLNSVLSCCKDQRAALRNPCGAGLFCSVVFWAGYREVLARFISAFGAVACHCKYQRPQGVWREQQTEWLVCIFLFSMSFWWGLCKQAHAIQPVRV